MASFTHFVATYKKYFIQCEDFSTNRLIESIDDIPSESKNYKIVVTRACALLSGDSSRLQHLKLLPSYSRYFEINKGKGTKKTEFALTLYIFHYLTLRILRSPWRKDYLIMKTYNGFYKHVLCKYLDISIIQQLLALVGFRLNHQKSAYEFTNTKLGSSAKQFLTECGVDFFLSYTQCRMRFDPDFQRELKQYQMELSKGEIVRNPRNVTRNEEAASSGSMKMSRTSHRRHEQDLDVKERPSTSSSWSNGSTYSSRSRTQETPLDLSLTETKKDDQPYSHRLITAQKVGRESHTGRTDRQMKSYIDDKALYGGTDPTRTNSMNIQESLQDSPENSVSGHVYYPPMDNFSNKSNHPSWRTVDSLENTTIPPPGSRIEKTQRRETAISPASSMSKLRMKNDNYVTFFRDPKAGNIAGRGSPDGEINKNEMYVDSYKDVHPGFRRSVGKERTRHIYHEIGEEFNDSELYDA